MRDTAARGVAPASPAIDRALREAGGGRLDAAWAAYEDGRLRYHVRFLRGGWLCTATVDPATGEVTALAGEPAPLPEPADHAPGRPVLSARLAYRTVWDVRAAAHDPAAAYVATDAGIAVVRLRHDAGWALTIEDHHGTGFGATRHVAGVPGGVVGTTGDGRVFRLDPDGHPVWDTRLPASPSTIETDGTGTRLLCATNAGAVELDAGTGRCLSVVGGPVRAAAFLPDGDRVLAGHRGDLLVVTPDAAVRWACEQGEYPERAWEQDGRVYVAGEGGLKEVTIGAGVTARWSVPGAESVENAVLAAGQVLTCGGGTRIDRHDYATAGYRGRVGGLPAHPEAITGLHAGDRPWLLAGHRDGTLTAQPLD